MANLIKLLSLVQAPKVRARCRLVLMYACNKELDDLRTAWLKEGNPAKRKELLDKFHAQAYEALPYINAGQYSPAVAVRKEIKGAERLYNGLPLFWFLDK